MVHYYANRWDFTLTFRALTDVHLGTGRLGYVEVDGELREVLVHAKSVYGSVYLPSTALKGAMRAIEALDDRTKALFFGTVGDTPQEAQAGRLVIFGGMRTNFPRANDAPGFDPSEGAMSYTRPQHARSRDTGTVLPRYLYHVENTPKGTEFTAPAMYFPGDMDEATAEDLLTRQLNELAAKDGFPIGAQKTTIGRMRLENISVGLKKHRIMSRSEEVGGRKKITVKSEVTEGSIEIWGVPEKRKMQSLHAPGPLLIEDPARAAAAAQKSDRRELVTELRYQRGELAGWERALRQSLRSLAGYLEATLDWSARKRIDDPFLRFRDYASLTSTQRLFGVEGYQGLMALHVYAATHGDRGVFPGLEIDTLTQGALEHAAYAVHCPVDGRIEMRVGIDTKRYAKLREQIPDTEREWDKRLIERLNEHVARYGLKAAGKVTRGFGWFDPFNLELVLDRSAK